MQFNKLFILFILLTPQLVFSQQSVNFKKEHRRPISISLFLGGTLLGPVKQLEEAMVAADFNDPSGPGWFTKRTISHPFSHRDISWLISAKRYISQKTSVGVIIGNSFIGETHGYNSESGYLFINYSVFTIGPMIYYGKYDIVKIGIGPVLYFLETKEIDKGANYKSTRLGLLFDWSLRIPKKTRFYVELNIQFRFVGSKKIGPFSSNGENILPKVEMQFNNLFWGVGLGLRI